MTATAGTRVVHVGERVIPVILPNRRDARLHTAAVIISLHVIGITVLGFHVSVPQILAAMLTAGIIDVVFTYRASQRLVWPASGLLTGSGVGLILRMTGMPSFDYWSFDGWYLFALVAAVSILSKFLIRVRGEHIFNPSNIGLVLAFLILGSSVVEPLDFWWGPLSPWLLVAYALIIGGGTLITRRLHLLAMAVTFWVVLAGGLGILALSGHCMTAAWSPTPVCDFRFWTVLVTSPEVLIFMFFMITDPKTVPSGRTARIAFTASLAVLTTLLMAPQTVEFGAKVALLGSLALWSPLRAIFDRALGREPDTAWAPAIERVAGSGVAPGLVFGRGLAAGAVVVVLTLGVIAAGIPARAPAALAAPTAGAGEVVSVDATTLPQVEIDSSVVGLAVEVDDTMAASIGLMLAENLATEAESMRLADGGMLGLVDSGDRLTEMQARLDEAIATGVRVAELHTFDKMLLGVYELGDGQQGTAMSIVGSGTVAEVTYDPTGVETGRTERAFDATFVLRQIAGDRWLTVAVEPG